MSLELSFIIVLYGWLSANVICGCCTWVWCCHSVVCLERRGKTNFFLSGFSECLKGFFPVYCGLVLDLTLQEKPFVLLVLFVRVGLFLMGSENKTEG